MGLLSEGTPLTWEETKPLTEHVRKHGVQQFINLYRKNKDRQGDVFKWGDEFEYIIVKFDDCAKQAKASLRAENLLEQLTKLELADPNGVKSLWRPEYAAFMIEGMPGKPYGDKINDLMQVETNMRYRREEISEKLAKDECVMSITSFPRLGCKDFSHPYSNSTTSKSIHFPDEAIYPGHPRFRTNTNNVLKRRGENMAVKLKIFKDKYTKLPVELSDPTEPDVLVLESMGFGMGCCCLQTTFQAANVTEARYLYDQLAPLCPIMLALTAASPIHAGYLTDTDCRWNIIRDATDCRTQEERGIKPLKENKFRIAKSRYDSIDSYLSSEGEKYNDIPVTYEQKVYQHLRESGIDHLMAQHIAHLFIRDTICLYREKIHQNDEEDSDHFENIQSANWQTMRFKPPPPNSTIGWRVEFRPCETQINDFENAAIVCFMSLLARVILTHKLDFLMPISKVDKNMQTAQKRDACRKEKFLFRKNIVKIQNISNGDLINCTTDVIKTNETNGANGSINSANGTNGYHHYTEDVISNICSNDKQKLNSTVNGTTTNGSTNGTANVTTNGTANAGTNGTANGITNGTTNGSSNGTTIGVNNCLNGTTTGTNGFYSDHEDELELISIDEIFNGKSQSFPGLVPLVRQYLQTVEMDEDTNYTIEQYLIFIQKRASGKLKTTATWLREQVLNHPDYNNDSIVNDRINYDILKKVQNIEKSEMLEIPLKQSDQKNQTPQNGVIPLVENTNCNGPSC